jgi:hypothetical protein
MNRQAAIIVSYRADSLGEAGEKLDDVLCRARRRGNVKSGKIAVRTPLRAGAVRLAKVVRAARPQERCSAVCLRETARPRREAAVR